MPANYTTTIGPLRHPGNDGRGARLPRTPRRGISCSGSGSILTVFKDLSEVAGTTRHCNLGLRWQNLFPNNGCNYNDVDALFSSWTRANREKISFVKVGALSDGARVSQDCSQSFQNRVQLHQRTLQRRRRPRAGRHLHHCNHLGAKAYQHRPARPHIGDAVLLRSQDISRGGRSSRAAIAPAPCTCTARQKPNDDDKTGVGTAGSVLYVVHPNPPPCSQAGSCSLYDQNTGRHLCPAQSSPAGSGISGNTTASKSDVKDDGGDKRKGRG
ncbi:hypothetical protein BBAD15_g7220 [Beauveria bassiana D1-5]|uniref:Uncharacterized protein n=1 Tax=Beauveria bassiana D1-5 TaxID=1245745 RepID=A0A0A2VMQ5_BEABA|nr:hypothetical protein BBAD15_g7220 [Beauveria bassiana D1-5]